MAKAPAKSKKTKKTPAPPVAVAETVPPVSHWQGVRSFFGRNRRVMSLVLVIALLVIGPSLFFYKKYDKAQEELKKSDSRQQSQQLVDDIGELVLLPTDEKPTVATVTDVTKLAKQPFFAKAKNGDKVLVYNKARRAILYRPSIDKVVDMVIFNANPEQAGSLQPSNSSISQP